MIKLSAYDVIVSPVITEKSTLVSEANQIIFNVAPKATKKEIKDAIETLFKVKVEKVRTLNYLGKSRRVGRTLGQRPRWKKAYVTLVEGQRIDFFENV